MVPCEIWALYWSGYHLICTIIYFTIFILGQTKPFAETENGLMVVEVTKGSWLYRLWHGDKITTNGFALGFFIIISPSNPANNIRLIRHESTHVWQQVLLGPLQPILYLLFSGMLLVVLRDFWKAYYYNPFEIQARRSE